MDKHTAETTLEAYLLTRQWRDTPSGVELSFWASSDRGPVKIEVDAQQSVCFIQRQDPLILPDGVVRKPLDLTLLDGEAVDGLYCKHQRTLQQLRQGCTRLCESDIKPTDRFLMERFIRTGIALSGPLLERSGYLLARNPGIKPGTCQPTLNTVSIDIETRAHSNTLYSIAAAVLTNHHAQHRDAAGKDGQPVVNHAAPASSRTDFIRTRDNPDVEPDGVVFMKGEGEEQQRDGYVLRYLPSEKELLNAFMDWLAIKDPDVLIGWAVVNFDLHFLDQKCRSLGIPFRLGRNAEPAAVLQPGTPGAPRIARVPGRAVLDGVDQLKAGFWGFESYSLDNVSHQLLGTGKLISSEQDKVEQINGLFSRDKPALADYNYRDCTLVNEIFIKANLLAFAQERANLTGLALDRVGGSVAAFDNLYLPRLHRRGYVAPDVPTRGDGPGSPGGYVMDSVPGLYSNVLVLDFKSLYPSIIRTFRIDPLGLAHPGKDPIDGFLEATFSREQHILPELIEELWAARDQAKRNQDLPLSQAIKIIMNSFYGVLGTTGCRFYSPRLASSITRRGHEIITRSRDWIEQQGFEVIYGDTDSVFVWAGNERALDECQTIGGQLMQGLNSFWATELTTRHRLESYLEVEYETLYRRFFMPTVRGLATGSKKRYAGLSVSSQTHTGIKEELVVKGLEAARTDWTPLAREFQRQLFQLIFSNEPFEQFIRDTADQVRQGAVDDKLIYRKRIRRRLNEYQRNVPPHIKAARRLPNHGSHIRYVMTRNGPEPVDAQESALDYQHYLDKQLAPAADSILKFLNTSFSAITDAQLQMF